MRQSISPGILKLLVTLCFLAVSRAGGAPGPWDGTWFLDAKQSYRPDIIGLVLSPDGTGKFFNGTEVISFVADGKAHQVGTSAIEIHATRSSADTLLIVKSVYGRQYQSASLSLSGDRRTLISEVRSLQWDGKERRRVTNYKRLGSGDTLQGSWKATPGETQPGAPNAAGAVLSVPPAQPHWIIWTSSDGTMTWYIPRTGEVLRGKADMVRRPIGGPYSAGETFTWKRVNQDRLDFTVYLDGTPVEYAAETMSPDGQTWTDTLWAAGYENSKAISIFRRQP